MALVLATLPMIGFICFGQFSPLVGTIPPFLISLSWGLLFFEALLGIGLLFCDCFPKLRLSNSDAPAIGLFFIILIGGYLNCFELLTRTTLSWIVISGDIIFYLMLWKKMPKLSSYWRDSTRNTGRLIIVLKILAILSIAWGYWSACNQTQFNVHDDYHAYLFFPEKVLQTGSLGVDPFSERRLISGFGANSLLLAFGLAQMEWYFLHSIDWGLGVLTFTYVVWFARFESVTPQNVTIKLGIIIFVCLLSIPSVNITANFLPMTLILVFWLRLKNLVDAGKEFSRQNIPLDVLREGIYVGGLLTALITLKSTLIPYIAFCTVFSLVYLSQVLRFDWGGVAKYCLGLIIIAAILLSPWMYDLYRSSGTFFYPLLGKGFHASQYGYFSSATSSFLLDNTFWVDLAGLFAPLLKSVFIFSLLLMLTLLLVVYRNREDRSNAILAALPILASVINCIVVGYALGGYGAYRYIYFVALSSLVAAICLSGSLLNYKQIRFLIYGACLFFFVRGIQDQTSIFKHDLGQFSLSMYDQNPISSDERARYKELSNSLPSDGKILLRVAYPFLLSINKNTLIADYPGSASPPPGIPLQQGYLALKDYLVSQGVRYLVWDYQAQANFSKEKYADRVGRAHPWIESEARLTFDFQDNLEALRHSAKVIFDKNGIAIIDLR